jgi:integrase
MPGHKVQVHLHITIPGRYWSSNKQRIHKSAPPEILKYNSLLDAIAKWVDDTILEARIRGKLYDGPTFRQMIITRFIKAESTQITTIKDYVIHWASLKEKSTKSKALNLINYFPVLWESITPLYIKELIAKLKEKYKDNTVNKYMSILNSILKEAKEDGLYKGTIYSKGIPTRKVIDHIYLTEDQITLLEDYAYSDKPLANIARLWLLMYYTGCRYQNLKDILQTTNIIYIQGDKYLRYRQIKTNKYVSIPYHNSLERCLAFSDKSVSNQKINEFIKDICQNISIPNAHEVTCHTARRSCITNLVLMGLELHLVMKVSGHGTEKELMRYVKYNDLIGAMKMNQSPIFHQWTKLK